MTGSALKTGGLMPFFFLSVTVVEGVCGFKIGYDNLPVKTAIRFSLNM